ncbi:MAG: carboxypeptidase regulatory-like domain-containing protein, partial [Planctomycetota bacterium]
MQGIQVKRAETTDLGDLFLGRNLVLRGRVLDGSGRPLPGTSVAVYTPSRGILSEGFLAAMVDQITALPTPIEQAITDEAGWFTLSSLGAGTYRIEVRHGGYATRYESGIVVSEDRPARDMKIVLGEGATVYGRVRDENGKPVGNARVVAVKDSGRRFFTSSTVERDVAFTDDAGSYALDTLMQGQGYRFGVMAEGYAPLFQTTATDVTLKREERDFQLVRGGNLAGRVVEKSDGSPVVGAQVLLAVGRMGFGRRRGGSDEENRAATGRAVTDDAGRFVIQNILPGPIMTAQVRASGYVPFAASMFTGNSWGDITAGETLEADAVELERGGTIEGKVTDAKTGAALVGAEVTIMPRERAWQVFMTGAPNATTDAEGMYRLSGVAPGTYGVIAVALGYAATDPSGEGSAGTLSDAGGTARRDLVLTRAGVLTGIVTDSNGEPVAGARVRTRIAPRPRSQGGGRRGGRGMSRMRAFLPGGTGADLTDQDGRYRIAGVSADDRWIVTAQADEFVPTESEPVQVQVDEVKELNIVLQGGGNLA